MLWVKHYYSNILFRISDGIQSGGDQSEYL